MAQHRPEWSEILTKAEWDMGNSWAIFCANEWKTGCKKRQINKMWLPVDAYNTQKS